MTKYWKEAASTIIAARSNIFTKSSELVNKSTNHDFNLLVLQRGKTSKFFPGGYVFPGGTVEDADSGKKWQTIFEQFGFQSVSFKTLISNAPQTNLFQDRNSSLPKVITLRITAIRETFEECGILLCKSKKCSTKPPSQWSSFIADNELKTWQKRVQSNPDDFIEMCNEFQCVPDVWSLHLWSNWLTPTNSPIRFDTVFFLATLDQIPPSFVNKREMDDIKWCSPSELLKGNTQEFLSLPPPQYYEVSRIGNFQNIENLNDFATKRVQYQCERWMPIQKQADDGIVAILPGDELYPETINYEVKDKLNKIEGSMENFRNNATAIHRMELAGENGIKIVISNVQPQSGHLLPVNCTPQN